MESQYKTRVLILLGISLERIRKDRTIRKELNYRPAKNDLRLSSLWTALLVQDHVTRGDALAPGLTAVNALVLGEFMLRPFSHDLSRDGET